MLVLLCGENAYERDQYMAAHGLAECHRYDGTEVDIATLRQLLQGVSLFSTQQKVIINGLSEQKAVWSDLGELLTPELIAAAEVVLLETKPDKRTKTYKLLQKHATVVQCNPFSEKDTGKAVRWLQALANERVISLSAEAATELVARVGVDQYRLLHELLRLAVVGEITKEVVCMHTPASPKEVAFSLLETALTSDASAVRQAVAMARLTADPYMTFGLVVSQVYAISGLVLTRGEDIAATELAATLGVHPFVLRNLQQSARMLELQTVRELISELAVADERMKTSDIDPWLAIETALLAVGRQ